MQSHLSDIDDPQIELHLLRSCLSLCKINYLLRTIPPDLITTSYNLFDCGLHQSLESIIHSSLVDTSMLQASLPISLGGLGLRRASSSAPAAYIGSLNSSKDLVLHLLRGDRDIGNDDVSVSNSSLREELQSLYPNVDIKLASQKSLQYAIDTESLDNLKASVPLRDKAQLNTIGTPETGAWLRAVPNPNLGFTMSRQEFTLSLSMWLGRHIFPHPVRCVCGQTIDNYGDHVLGCGHGPLRIKCHDALSEVVWHTLLMDNKGALREQRCGTNNNNHPGDVFHPDFSFGKPGYFDVSVRNSFQSQFLSRASEHPGAAGEAGELDKDDKHEKDVTATGGLFFPLIVETFGIWTPNSLRTLKIIASKAASIN